MKKKKPKRFTSHDSIITAIDREQESLQASMKLAEEYDAEISTLKEWFGIHQLDPKESEESRTEWHGRHERLKILMNESGIRHRSIPRHNRMLRQLKATLASFDTVPMLGIVPDVSVLLAETTHGYPIGHVATEHKPPPDYATMDPGTI